MASRGVHECDTERSEARSVLVKCEGFCQLNDVNIDEQLVHFTRRTSGFLVNIATVGKRGHYGVAVDDPPLRRDHQRQRQYCGARGVLNKKKYRNMEWLCCPNHWGINMGYSTF